MTDALAGAYTEDAEEVTLYLADGWSLTLNREDNLLRIVTDTGAHEFDVTDAQCRALAGARTDPPPT